MASRIGHKDLAPTLAAANDWMQRCLIDDGSILSNKQLWTTTLVEEVKRAFVDNPDEGDDTFIRKLQGQMKVGSAGSKQLAAEMVWILLLFPSNNSPDLKRKHVLDIWALSGETLEPRSSTFDDAVLKGIGSGGAGYNNNRYRELAYLISATQSLKEQEPAERRHVLSDYDAFIGWISSVPQEGRRQFPQMLRYFAFPDRVERMSSNGDRWRILEAFGVAKKKETRDWNDRQLDEALLALRRRLEQEHPGEILDFYDPPLSGRWNAETLAGDLVGDQTISSGPQGIAEATNAVAQQRPVNLILYGPPGTGKTFWLRKKFEEYTDQPASVDHETWLQELVANYSWRSVIVAALVDAKGPARVPDIREHPLIAGKTKQRGRSGSTVTAAIWATLQSHTPESSPNVKYASRRPPFIFSKSDNSEWELLKDWRDLDDESVELVRAYRAGPAGASQPVRRYRVVTFHPSFSYEEFVRGIRPVMTSDDGTTQFRVVDGVLKQICDEARANPKRRYALFIDEINRANIAKVFGELITLIEADKRVTVDEEGRVVSGMQVQLPGNGGADLAEQPFGVPANLDIYGTMNTADRSIALLDVALRRRFEFWEMEPDYRLLQQVVDGVEVSRVLKRLNDRLEYLLDRDHRVGHAYLMTATSLDDLRRAFSTQVIPLLQEYFFDDLSRVAAVLTTAPGANPFIASDKFLASELFLRRLPEDAQAERLRYTVTPTSTWTADSFKGLYAEATRS